jgi:hypothetical protein
MSQQNHTGPVKRFSIVVSCKKAAALISLSFERRLTLAEYVLLQIHLWSCRTCMLYKHQIAALRQIFLRHEELLQNTPADEQETLPENTKEKIEKIIKDQLERPER